jgi:hypothetical protein
MGSRQFTRAGLQPELQAAIKWLTARLGGVATGRRLTML